MTPYPPPNPAMTSGAKPAAPELSPALLNMAASMGAGGQQPAAAQQTGGIEALQKAISELADVTNRVMQIGKMVFPQTLAYVDKIVQVGKALQEDVAQFAQGQASGAGQGSAPPMPTNPAEAPPPGMVGGQ